MKEWLNIETYEYKKAFTMSGHSNWIEIPDGAEFYAVSNDHYAFFNDDNFGIEWFVLWQRKETLNDQVASAELARQERDHNHYCINVSDTDEVDFYEIALRYNVTDPCIQHILKKCLAVGSRGHKDFHTDLKDIHDTAKRALIIHGVV